MNLPIGSSRYKSSTASCTKLVLDKDAYMSNQQQGASRRLAVLLCIGFVFIAAAVAAVIYTVVVSGQLKKDIMDIQGMFGTVPNPF